MNSPKNLNSFGSSHTSIALVGIKSIDVAIHNVVRGLIIFVSTISKLPGILFLVPAIVNAQFPTLEWVPYNYYLLQLFCLYLLAVALFVGLCLTLYFVSENPAAREWLCRYLDAPDIVYPADFDEDKERDIAEKGFTFRYLGDERDHTVRVIAVPIAFLCLSTTVTRSIAACVFGM